MINNLRKKRHKIKYNKKFKNLREVQNEKTEEI